MFLLAFLSRRANKQGVWIGIVANLIFTAWATLSSGKNKMLDLGDYNFPWAGVMIGVIGHVIVFVVGYGASWIFPADTNVKLEWTLWGWLEKRKTASLGAPISDPARFQSPQLAGSETGARNNS